MEEEKKTMQAAPIEEELENLENTKADDLDPANPNALQNETKEKPIKPKADDIVGDVNLKNKVTDLTHFQPLSHIMDQYTDVDHEVETTRERYMKKINKSKIYSILLMVLVLVAFGGVMAVIFLNKEGPSWITYTVFGIAIAIMAVMFAGSSILSKKDQKSIKSYLSEYEDIVNSYMISDLDVTDATLCSDAKVDETSFIQAHCYRTIDSIDSRGVLLGKRKGREYTAVEMAVSVPPLSLDKANELPENFINLDGTPYFETENVTDTLAGTQELQSKDMTLVDLQIADEANGTDSAKKRKGAEEKAKKEQAVTSNRYGLFGRFTAYGMRVKSEESFILYFLGDRRFNMVPNYLTGFKAVKVPGLRSNILVFLSDPSASAKFFDAESIRLLNDIVPDVIFQSGFISVNSYGTRIGYNLDDAVMNVPFKNPVTPNAISSMKEANDRTFAFIDHIDELRDGE